MSKSLVNIPKINQEELKKYYRFSIRNSQNIIALGPAGAGKTEMGFQSAKEEGLELVYWNMSVTERPDIQGIPVVSDDKRNSSYAAPETLPFTDIQVERSISLLKEVSPIILDALSERKKKVVGKDFHEYIESLEQMRDLNRLENAANKISDSKIKSHIDIAIAQLRKKCEQPKPVVLMLDEIDKAPRENLQPLLELAQSYSINQRDLNLACIFMTGNLPDEQTFSEPLSHALTDRAMVFELAPNFDSWKKWAVKNDIHPSILGFLSRDETSHFFYKHPKKNALYSYNYPTPRSWARSSRLISMLEKEVKKKNPIWNHFDDELMSTLMAACIGEEAATQLKVWVTHYRNLDPVIDAIYNGDSSQMNNVSNDFDKLFVVGTGLLYRWTAIANKADEKSMNQLREKAKYIFPLIYNSMPDDAKIAVIRSTFNEEIWMKAQLHEIPETKRIWSRMNEFQEEVKNEFATNS